MVQKLAGCTTYTHVRTYGLYTVSSCVVWLVWLELVSPLWAPGLAAVLAALLAPSNSAAAFAVIAQAYRRLGHNSHYIVHRFYYLWAPDYRQSVASSSIRDWFWPDSQLVAIALPVA